MAASVVVFVSSVPAVHMRRTPPESRGAASAPSTAGRQLARRRREASAERRNRGSRGDRYPPGGEGGGVNSSRSLDEEAGARDTSASGMLDSVVEVDSSSPGWEESDSDGGVVGLVGAVSGTSPPTPNQVAIGSKKGFLFSYGG